jgi:hypothetical protein
MTNRKRLTVKQEDFARLVGLEGKTHIEAYRTVYPNKCKDTVAAANAYKLTIHPAVSQKISQYRDQREQEKKIDAGAIRELLLKTLIDKVKESKTESNQLRAVELLGKTEDIGLFKERIETTQIKSGDDLEKELREKLHNLFGKPKLVANG